MATNTPNMNLPESTIATDSGLTWEQNLNKALTKIDQHNHTSGNGVQIPPSGLNINGPLAFNNQQITALQAVNFTQQTSLSTPNALFVGTDGNLYFNDGNADPSIKITAGGAVNATSSGITSGSATASFVSGVLVVNSATNTPANIQAASLLLGNIVAGSKYLTLSPPASMAANYTLTLPAIPSVQSIMTLDTSGNIVGAYTVDNSSLQVSSNQLSVKAQGVQQTMLAPRTITTGGSTAPAGGVAISIGSGSYSTTSSSLVLVTGSGSVQLQANLITTGRPVRVQLVNIQPGTLIAGISVLGNSNAVCNVALVNGSTLLSNDNLQISIASTTAQVTSPPGAFNVLDTSVAGTPGTYTYKLQVASSTGSLVTVANCAIMAYED